MQKEFIKNLDLSPYAGLTNVQFLTGAKKEETNM